MPTYEITGPDGSKYEVSGPGTEEEALAQVQAQHGQPQQDMTAPGPAINPDTMQPAGVPEFQPPGVSGYDPKTGEVDKMGAMGTFAAAMPEGVPIAGPLLDKAATAASAGIGSLISGDPYAKVHGEMDAMRKAGNEAHPVAQMGGNLAGALATLGPIGATEAGGWALGTRGASLGGRMLNSAVSGAGISAADTAARGGDLTDIGKSGLLGGGLGGALPGAGALVKGGLSGASEWASRLINSAKNPAKEAERRLGTALSRDVAANPGGMLNPADEAAAQAANIPVTNIDRGGETTRALARSVANKSPEVRGTLNKVANDRYAGQSQRGTNFLQSLMGNNLDDVAAHDNLQAAARRINGPAYKGAYRDGADLIKTPELERLMGSPAVVSAMKSAIKTGKDRAVKEGMGTFNPAVSVTDDGRVLFNKTNPAGGTTFPDLQFWDYTKRELDDMANAARASGRKGEADTLGGLATSLRNELDNIVPSYKAARQGAASFFGADDALTAGKNFASPKGMSMGPEMRKAHAALYVPEKELFANGFAAGLVQRVKNTPDSLNVINSIFKKQASREAVEMALGPVRTKQIEAYVRVESLVDQLRGTLGNSTTARQLTELGIGATGGYAYGGDLSSALTGAAVMRGAGYVGGVVNNRLEQNVLKELGKMLSGDDPALMQRVITNASLSPKYMEALDKIGGMLAAPARVGIVGANQPGQ